MYLRHTTQRKNGKVHRYWRLVRSVRVGRRVIQQTVAHLGELDDRGRIEARGLARRLIGAPEDAQLFDDGSRDVAVPVRLKGIRVERSRQFGDVYLALALWRGMGLEDLCERLLPPGQERVSWAKMAAVLVTARFCEPSSELHIAEDWYRRTALCDLLQLGDEEVNKDRLYRGLDHLLAHKAALETHLSKRCGELFAIQNEVLLYDVTSTYFEGLAEANPQAQRGYSRDHRPDCKQICIALVVTFDGFPLGYEVFAGNTHDSKTLQTIVATMEARHGVVGRVWISDRGMASAENLAWLRETGRRYIIGAPKSELKKFAAELARPDGWRTVQEGVEVKLVRHPETEETVILCRSADRRSKERAMHDKFSQRIDAALQRLAARITRSKKRLDPAQVNRQIGRILQQNQRAAARFAIALQPDSLPGRISSQRELQRHLRQLGGDLGRLLSPQIEHRRLERSAALEGVHPAHPGRSRFPHPEGPAERPPDLASARGPRPSSHPGLLPRLRPLEVPRDVAEPRRSRKLPAHDPRRARAHSVTRRRPADGYPWPSPPALRRSTRRRASRATRSPRHRPAQAHAAGGTRTRHSRTRRLIHPRKKCSAKLFR
jgi:Transposase DDE domain